MLTTFNVKYDVLNNAEIYEKNPNEFTEQYDNIVNEEGEEVFAVPGGE